MAKGMSFEFSTGEGKRVEGEPFRVLLMGDFSGRRQRGTVEPLIGRKIAPLDVDNWEGVLASLGPSVTVPAGQGGAQITIDPEEIDDFHPDVMFEKLEVFKALRSLRARLTDSSTFAEASGEVRLWAGAAPAEAAPAESDEAPAQPAGPAEADTDTLGRLLGDRPAQADQPASGPASSIDAIIRSIVGPHIVPDVDIEQSALVGRVDDAIAAQMRTILHDPNFQALEAAWRSVHFLVTHLEMDEQLQLHLMDVTKDELTADLASPGELDAKGLYERLVTRTVATAGGKPLSLVVGAFTFDKTAPDVVVLIRLAQLVAAAGAAFVGGAADRVAGCESLAAETDPRNWTLEPDPTAAAAWDQLRKLPEAGRLALGLPRMLLRLPYGKATDPIEAFAFEECDEACGHEGYLWGNAAFALATALAMGFTERGRGMAAELYRDVEDLPMHVYTVDGERHIQPCAEVYLTDRAGQALQEMGLTALLSVQGRNIIRIRGVAALTAPVAALTGPWGG